MYFILNNVAYISGNEGKYDKKINNKFVRYGRNAADNYKKYTEDLSRSSTPLEFEYRYTPSECINRLALLGNAYEELGQKTRVKTEDLNKKLAGMKDASADALDLNKDGYVDVAEYSTSTLVQDILSSDDGFDISPEKADGVINNSGETKSMALLQKCNEKMARNIYKNLYNDFNLGQAQQEFIANDNNF